ncbi:MAG: helicase-associated domain-containing protein [Leucobacter sp.]
MSGTLVLAASIATMDRSSLERLVVLRPPLVPGSVQDPIGLAIDLLRPESIIRILHQQDRRVFAALVRLGQDSPSDGSSQWADELVALGLAGVEDGRPVSLPEVVTELTALLTAQSVDVAHLGEPPSHAPDTNDDLESDTDETGGRVHWFGQALTTSQRAAAILRIIREQPGRLNRRGTVPVTALRMLAERTQSDQDGVAHILDTLGALGLTAHGPADASGYQQLHTTVAMSEWLRLPHTERWFALARAHAAKISAPLRASLSQAGHDLRHAVTSVLPHEYPLLPRSQQEAARAFVDTAEELGLAVIGKLTEPGRLLFDGLEAEALRAAEADMPPAVPSVYVQPDLSVIVPGPLSPTDEQDLLAFAEVEQLGIASSLRISGSSVSRALETGWTADQVREVLGRLSLTGIPQPLEYLLDEVSQRVGSITVHEYTGDAGRTRVAVAKPEMFEAMLVDRALQHLQFAPLGDGALVSRLAPEHVLAALTTAKYPATGPGGTYSPHHISNGADGSVTEPGEALPDPLAQLVERVQEAAKDEPGRGTVTRLLELAIRDRSPVLVSAEARGRTYTFTLLPVSLNSGRLRATDQVAGVERTLPVTAITDVAPVTPAAG